MPAYTFRKEYVPAIKSGLKRQTIRKKRRRGNPKVGDVLYLYTGMRTKDCKKIIETTCTDVSEICIMTPATVFVDDVILTRDMIREVAADDGFSHVLGFIGFFRKQYGLPFDGLIIKW